MAEDITLGNRSEETGRFNFVWTEDDDVQFDETGAHAVVTSCLERKGSNPFDSSHGTNLWKLKSLTSRTPDQAEAEVLEGCKSLEDAGEIQQLAADSAIDSRAINRLSLDVSWKPGTGELQTETIEV